MHLLRNHFCSKRKRWWAERGSRWLHLMSSKNDQTIVFVMSSMKFQFKTAEVARLHLAVITLSSLWCLLWNFRCWRQCGCAPVGASWMAPTVAGATCTAWPLVTGPALWSGWPQPRRRTDNNLRWQRPVGISRILLKQLSQNIWQFTFLIMTLVSTAFEANGEFFLYQKSDTGAD